MPDDLDFTELSPLEATLMERLASTRVSNSVVVAAQWAEDSRRCLNHEVTHDLVVWLLKDLNQRGLVVYSLSDVSSYEGGSMWDVPINIRVTELGYKTLGYDKRIAVVGIHRDYRGEASPHPGDLTDFHNQKMTAPYSPCERMPLEEHLALYPDHRFNKGGF